MRDHAGLRLARQTNSERGEKAAFVLASEIGFVGEHGGFNRVQSVEVCDLRGRGKCRRRDLDRSVAGIEFLQRQQAVKGVSVSRRSLIVLARRCFIAACFCDAAKPVSRFRPAERAVRRRGKIFEMLFRDIQPLLHVARPLQIAEHDPSRHEGLFLERVDGQRPGIFDERIGEPVVAGLERLIGKGAPLVPPFVKLCDLVGVGWNGKNELRGGVRPAGFAKHLNAMIREARIGCVVRNGVQKLMRVLSAAEHSEAHDGFLALGGRQQRNDPLRDRRLRGPAFRPSHIARDHPIKPPFVIVLGQQRPEAAKEARFKRCRNAHLAPAFGGDLLRFRCVALGKVSGRQRRIADAGFGRLGRKIALDG